MAFTEIEAARLKKVVGAFIEQRRPPPHIRPQLDLGFSLSGQSIEIFEIRPVWRGAPGEIQHQSVAKATFVRSSNAWRVFWQRADLKWHTYVPASSVSSIEQFLALVAEDKHACFFG